jgi:putative ABC transport system ATP-binding protein
MTALIEAQGLTRTTADGRTLFGPIDLRVEPAERVAVSGPTGSGKTLLLRSLALLDPISGGTILFRGGEVSCRGTPAYRSQVVYLHQRPSLFPGTVAQNLRLPLGLDVHRGRRFDVDFAIDRFARFGRASDFLDRTTAHLSGGEMQIVALVRTLQLAPTILLLDEATSALDPAGVETFESLIDEWRTGERAVVWVSHQVEQTRRVADRVIRMPRPDAAA